MDESKIDADEISGFALFCRNILNIGGRAIILGKFFIAVKRIGAFWTAWFIVLQYLYAVPTSSSTVCVWRPCGFQKNVALYGGLALDSGILPEMFAVNVWPQKFENELKIVGGAGIENVSSPGAMLMRDTAKKTVSKTEEIVPLLIGLTMLYTQLSRFECDLFTGTVWSEIMALTTGRTNVSMERDEACISLSIFRLPNISNCQQNGLGCRDIESRVNVWSLLEQDSEATVSIMQGTF